MFFISRESSLAVMGFKSTWLIAFDFKEEKGGFASEK